MRKLLVLLITILSIGIISCKKDNNEENNQIVPLDLNDVEALSKVSENFLNKDNYYIETTGETISQGIIKVHQYSWTVQIFDRSNYFYYYKESVSKSSFKKTGDRRLFSSEGVYVDKAKTVEVKDGMVTNHTWENNKKLITLEEHEKTYGFKVAGFVGYELNSDTILSSSSNKQDDKIYYTFILDPDNATKDYKKEIAYYSDSNEITFTQVTLIVITYLDYNVLEVNVEESYKVKIPVLGYVNLLTKLHNKYYYDKDHSIEAFLF